MRIGYNDFTDLSLVCNRWDIKITYGVSWSQILGNKSVFFASSDEDSGMAMRFDNNLLSSPHSTSASTPTTYRRGLLTYWYCEKYFFKSGFKLTHNMPNDLVEITTICRMVLSDTYQHHHELPRNRHLGLRHHVLLLFLPFLLGHHRNRLVHRVLEPC